MEEMIGRLDEIAGQLKRIGDALEALSVGAKEGKETFPPNTPYKEKGESIEINTNARTREGKLTCEGFLVPTLDDVKAHAAMLGIPADIAEDFWNTNSATGWTYRGSRIVKWGPLLQSWHRSVKRKQARDAKLTAHIDAKMDEREAKRERRTGGGRRKADNWIPSTEAERRGFADALGR